MKKILGYFGVLFLGIGLGIGILMIISDISENKYDIKLKFNAETKKYIKECTIKVYPNNIDQINIYNDDLKKLDYKYHQCLKNVIISKINQLAKGKDADKISKALEQIQAGVLNLYWDLYNREDNGTLGREANDAAMGFYYEVLLDDIILFQQNFIWNSDDTIPKP